jgi:exodeoxyribonuclease-3
MVIKDISIVSFNINGLRKKLDLLKQFNDIDIICIQENKLTKELPYLMKLNDYIDFHSISKLKKGYSGVSIYTKMSPKSIIKPEWDNEGRILVLEFDNTYLINVYVPNAGRKLERLKYKIDIWMNEFINFINTLKNLAKKEVIIVGDFNATISNDIIDIHAYQPNVAGNTPIEILMLKKFIQETKTIDVFRSIYPETKKYTYWSNFNDARHNNKGWRIDYVLIKINLLQYVKSIEILTDVYGSDHVPILLKIDMPL